MTAEAIVFFFFSSLAIASAVLMIIQRNPVMSAIYLIANFFCLAALYLLLRAQLLAVLQIVVYTGAIMVLVVFVIMLLNLGDEKKLTERYDFGKIAGVVLVMGFLLEMVYMLVFAPRDPMQLELTQRAEEIGSVRAMGTALFGKFILPFEVTSLLLLVAIVGAVILAKRRTS